MGLRSVSPASRSLPGLDGPFYAVEQLRESLGVRGGNRALELVKLPDKTVCSCHPRVACNTGPRRHVVKLDALLEVRLRNKRFGVLNKVTHHLVEIYLNHDHLPPVRFMLFRHRAGAARAPGPFCAMV